MSAIIYALSANAGIAASKTVAAAYTGSSAMLAEAVHSAADCANQLLLLLGIRQAKRQPTPDHPLGFGKATYFWSFMVAIMLFSLGGAFSIYEGVHKLSHPEPLANPWVAIIVLGVGVLLEAWSLRGCIHEIREKAGDMPLWRYFRDSRESELIVVMGEDIAALAGLTLALGAILLSLATGNPAFDAWGSIAVGALLVVVAIGVGLEVKALLIGQSAEPAAHAAMEQWLRQRPEVETLYNLISFQMGSYLFVAVKARMAEQQSASGLIDQINAVQDALKASFPDVRWVFFEPDDKG
ncbi:cation diffusion facilitator family transporter [Azospira oryzae]|uniref:cation diffusion facilitator family transporter n=1 Tax=Azospira oryzae TaxID=146939 RepID=UPI001964E76D|nr:cation diffusion facilitator family transporter [Azospira oryzae]